MISSLITKVVTLVLPLNVEFDLPVSSWPLKTISTHTVVILPIEDGKVCQNEIAKKYLAK